MADPSIVGSDLLLGQILLPLIGAVLLTLLTPSETQARVTACVVALVLAASSLVLNVVLFAGHSGESAVISVGWGLPLTQPDSLVAQILWRADELSAPLLALTPWVAFSAILLGSAPRSSDGTRRTTSIAALLLLAGMNLFIVADDLCSLGSGALLSIGVLAGSIARSNTIGKRPAATTWLAVQSGGLMLVTSAVAVFIAVVGMIRSAPSGPPQATSGTFAGLSQLALSAFEKNPAAMPLWGEYQGLPTLLLVTGMATMGALFPLHHWLKRVLASCSIGEQLWCVYWLKCVLFVCLKLLGTFDPQMLTNGNGWGTSLVLVGCIVTACSAIARHDAASTISSCILWSQQLVILPVLLLPESGTELFRNLLICQFAGCTILILVWRNGNPTAITSTAGETSLQTMQGVLRTSDEGGRSSIRTWPDDAGWRVIATGIGIVCLTLMPLPVGLQLAWRVAMLGQQAASLTIWIGSLLLLLANLILLGGGLKNLLPVTDVANSDVSSQDSLSEPGTGGLSLTPRWSRTTYRGLVSFWCMVAIAGGVLTQWPLLRLE